MIIPVGYAQVNLKFEGASVPTGAEMTFGLTDLGGDQPIEVAAAVETAWDVANMGQFQAVTIALRNILVKFGPNEDGPSAELGVNYPGTVAGAGVAPSECALIKKITLAGGRKNRGRMFMPGLRDTDIDQSGSLDGNVQSDLQDSWVAFKTSLEGATYTMTLLHTNPADTPTEITTLEVDSVSATQRRRLRR